MSFIDASLLMNPSEQRPSIVALEFWIEYEGEKSFEMVRYAKKGQTNPTEIVEKVARLSKPIIANGKINPVWLALKGEYDAWKAGLDAPIDGTPLEVWPGATKELIKALRPYNLRSLEDLGDLNDSVIGQIRIPGIRVIRARARAFIQARTTTAPFADELAKKDERIDFLQSELNDLRGMIAEMQADKPKRGRPPKQDQPEVDRILE